MGRFRNEIRIWACRALWNIENPLFHKNGRISTNYCPIIKIQNLAYSGKRPRPVKSPNIGARDVTREMTSRARRHWPRSGWLQLRDLTNSAKITASGHHDFDYFILGKSANNVDNHLHLLSSFWNTFVCENRTTFEGVTVVFIRQCQGKMHEVTTHVWRANSNKLHRHHWSWQPTSWPAIFCLWNLSF